MLNLPPAEHGAFADNEAPGPHLDVLHALSYRVAGTALRLGVFEQLSDEPRTADDVAMAIGGDPRGTRVLLDALVGFEYAVRDESAYRAAPGAKWLGTGYRTVFSFWHRVLFDQWRDLERSIVEGNPAVDFYGWLGGDPEALGEFQAMLGELADAVVPDLPLSLPNARRLLDIGGGHARYATAFCQANPDLRATVLDLPGTLDTGRAHAAALDGRIEFREGDWLTDDLGADHDVVLLFNVLHCLAPDRARDLLRRVGDAAQAGATVLILEETPDVAPEAGGTGAAWVPMFSLNLFHTQGGQIHAESDLAEWLSEAGFGDVSSIPVPAAPTFRLYSATMAAGPRRWEPTIAQRQMLTFDRLFPGSTWYNVPLYARITGPLDTEALRGSLRRCVARHESLRTRYPDGTAELIETAPVLTEVDLTGQGEAAVQALRERELRTPFDLAQGPPMRATLARISAEEHELILVTHHISIDGYSLTLLQRDILDGYADPAHGADGPRYSEFALRRTDSVTEETQLSFWRTELADLPERMVLPFAATTADPGLAADLVTFTVPNDVSAALRDVAKAQRSSPFMVLLSAFGVLLRRYSGAADLVIGTPVAGRDHPGTEDLVGCLVNMVPLRLRLADAVTWSDVLTVVRSAALDAFDNVDVPFARVVDQLAPTRSASIHPVFQVAFAAPPALAAPSTVDDMRFAFAEGTSTESLFDIEVQVIDEGDAMRGYLKYRTALFSREHMTGVVDHFLHLAGQLAEEPDAKLVDVSLLRPDQRHRAVAEWNDTRTDYPREATLVALVEARVDATPDADAAVYGDQVLTYRELDERANRLAHHLRDKGIDAESKVGLCLEFGADWVMAALAVLKAGGVYVPLDPAYPASRLDFMCADSGVEIVLAHESLRDRVTGPVVTLDGELTGPTTRLDIAAHADNLAYVMYTSGSTGRPKGVGVTHRNIVRLVRDTDYVHFGPGDAVAQVSNLSFDAATFELWGPLCAGGRIVGVPKDDLLSAPALGKALRDNGIDIMFLTTTLARRLAAEAPETFAPLRLLLVGGEQADADMLHRLVGLGGPEVRNAYGPTETTTFALSWPARVEHAEAVPIGRPIANSTAYVLDDHLEPCAPGLVGEIFLGGDGVARGYVGRADLTAERFVPDPFGVPGSRLYRTGDLGRYRADGLIECLGRIDRQVKIRGFRIEPGEVEDCLRETGQTRQVTVQVRQTDDGEAMLVGYVVPTDPAASMADLRAELQGRLPEYLVPAVLVAMETLPVNANGKLDVAALPDPLVSATTPAAEPTTEAERVVRAIWREVLGNQDIGVHDDFFALGGHSIKAGQVVTRIRAELRVPVSLRQLFDNPTVASLAAALPSQ